MFHNENRKLVLTEVYAATSHQSKSPKQSHQFLSSTFDWH